MAQSSLQTWLVPALEADTGRNQKIGEKKFELVFFLQTERKQFFFSQKSEIKTHLELIRNCCRHLRSNDHKWLWMEPS